MISAPLMDSLYVVVILANAFIANGQYIGSASIDEASTNRSSNLRDCSDDTLKLDIEILLDSSSSIGAEEFTFGLDFLKNLVARFGTLELIGGSGARFGMVQFNGVPYLEFHLNRHDNSADLIRDIGDTEYIRGVTLTGKAIELVVNAAFRESRGDRSSAPNILIILTDGWSQSYIPAAVEDARGRGVDIFVVGIGGPRNYQELLLLAYGRGDHIFELPSAANKTQGADLLVERTVEKVIQRLRDVYAWRICGRPTTTRATPLTSTTTSVTSERLTQSCQAINCVDYGGIPVRADVAILMDTTSSVTQQNFISALDFLVNMTRQLDRIGACHTRIGMVQYSTLQYLEIPLDKHDRISNLVADIGNVQYMQGFTWSRRSSRRPLRQLIKDSDRRLPRIVIVFTDGWGHSEVETAVFDAASDGATVFVVGLQGPRRRIQSRILTLAQQRRENVFTLPDRNNGTLAARLETQNSLAKLINRLKRHVRKFHCDDAVPPEVTSRPLTRFTYGTYPTRPVTGKPTKITSQPLTECSLLDAVFLVDSSSSINYQNHGHLLKFMSSVIRNFNSLGGGYGAQFGMVQYSEQPYIEFFLNRHQNRSRLIADIEDTEYIKGATWTGRAIDATVADVFQPSRGDRPEAPNTIIIITDGWAKDDIETAAWRASRRGIQLFVVGVAPDFDFRHLEELALTRTERISILPAYDNLTRAAAEETDRSIQQLVDSLIQLSNDACIRIAGGTLVTSERLQSTVGTPTPPAPTQTSFGVTQETKKTTRGTTLGLSTDPEEPLPEDSAIIDCRSDGFSIRIQTNDAPFTGWMFIKGRFEEPECAKDHSANNRNFGTLDIQLGECGITRTRTRNPPGVEISGTVVMMHDRIFIRPGDRAFRVRCFYMAEIDKTVTNSFDIPGMVPTERIEVSAQMPSCQYSLRLGSRNGPSVRYAEVGSSIYHRWDCEEVNEGTYGMVIHSCSVSNPNGQKTVQIVDEVGCVSDSAIMEQLVYSDRVLSAHTSTRAFGFADAEAMLFTCRIKFCLKFAGGCDNISPPECQFRIGRKKRRSGKSSVKLPIESPENITSRLTVVEFFDSTPRRDQAISDSSLDRYSIDLSENYCLSRLAVGAATTAGILASSLCLLSSAILFRRFRPSQLPEQLFFNH